MSVALIITGMHRSGTSLAASFVKALGVDIGENFYASDTFNIKGYFEDVDFLEFQRLILQNCCCLDESGWPDWGWTESEELDRSHCKNYLETAKELINTRTQKSMIWGWKDPRTSLMLDFWNELLPEARYLFVYRYPWDVADSIARLNAAVFYEHPDYADKIWAYYNRHLIQFYQQHSERCILVNINTLINQPTRLIDLLENKLGLKVTNDPNQLELQQLYENQLFKTIDWNTPVVKNLYRTAPQYFSLLAELDQIADIPSDFSLTATDWDLENSTDDFSGLSLTESSETASKIELGSPMQELNQNEVILSVVIPCYNHGEFILEAISSVESCQDRVYEIVIVNDASTEPLTKRVLKYLRDKGYFVVEHQKNQGLAQARNTGIAKARGRYILPLDSDNKIRPEYITESIEILDRQPEIGVVYGNAEYFGERTGIWEVPDFDINHLAARNYIDACAVFRQKVWEDCGGYDSKIPDRLGYEDWDFWLGAAEKGWKFYHNSKVLFDYRVRADSMVSSCRIPENHEKLVRYICTKHLGIYTTNFASVLAQKDAALLKEQIRYEELEMELQQTHAVMQESQEQVERIQIAWEEAQEQLQQTHGIWEQIQTESEEQIHQVQTAWEEAQEQIRETYANWETSQAGLQDIQTAWETSQEELRRTQTAWETSQEELRQTHAAWEQSHAQLQQTHAAWETSHQQSQEQSQRIQTAWEQSQEELRQTHALWQQSQEQLQRIQTAWEQSQEQLQQNYATWEQSQEQLQRIQTAWEQSQQELRQNYAAWEEAQQQLRQTHAGWEEAQQQLRQTHAGWEEAQQQLRLIQGAWEQSQEELRQTRAAWEQSQFQLQQMQANWETSQAQMQSQFQSQLQQMQTQWEIFQAQMQTERETFYAQLQSVRVELEQARSTIDFMERSKFWKFRTVWFRFKQAIGLTGGD